MHIPVLKPEVLSSLNIRPDGIYLDGTIGLAGHASSIESLLSERGILVGLDGDKEALRHSKTILSASSIRYLFSDSYDNFPKYLDSLGIGEVDGMLLDLGLSSYQIESAHRGFSYRIDGPLDMRFDVTASQTAEEIVNRWSERKLKEMIWEFSEERQSARIARAIVQNRKTKPITTTFELRDVVTKAVHTHFINKTVVRVFQAIRIAVNRELESLQNFLDVFVDYLAKGGRIVIISYHSLEDRLVKRRFKELVKGCICPPDFPICRCGREPSLRILTPTPVTPGESEVRRNPRARSAKLRAGEKIL